MILSVVVILENVICKCRYINLQHSISCVIAEDSPLKFFFTKYRNVSVAFVHCLTLMYFMNYGCSGSVKQKINHTVKMQLFMSDLIC